MTTIIEEEGRGGGGGGGAERGERGAVGGMTAAPWFP